MTLNIEIGGFVDFGDFGLRDAFQEQIVPNSLQVDCSKLHMKFSALNVDFNGLNLDFLRSMKPAVCAQGSQRVVYPKSRYFTVVGQSIVNIECR